MEQSSFGFPGASPKQRVFTTIEEKAEFLRTKTSRIKYNDFPEEHPWRNRYIPCKTIRGDIIGFPRDPFIKRVRAGNLVPCKDAGVRSRFSLLASESQETQTNGSQKENNIPSPNEIRPPSVADNIKELQMKIAAIQVNQEIPINKKKIDETTKRKFGGTFSGHGFGCSFNSNNNNIKKTAGTTELMKHVIAFEMGEPRMPCDPPASKKRGYRADEYEKAFNISTGIESLPLAEKKAPSVANKKETPMLTSANLRACIFCSSVKPMDVFLREGCLVCNSFVSMKGDMEKVNECITKQFVGIANIINVVEKCALLAGKPPGIYAIVEEPSAELMKQMNAEGVKYRPLAHFK